MENERILPEVSSVVCYACDGYADMRSSCVLVKEQMIQNILWEMLHQYTRRKTSQNISTLNNIRLRTSDFTAVVML
jgi:hypothetical protein